MKLNLLSVMLVGSGLFLTACGGGKGDNSSTSSNIDVNKIQNPVVSTPVAYEHKQDYPPNAAESVVMTYKMKGITGKETQATALVFTPRTAPPAGGWPIVVWAHGTTGVADKCAPSKNRLIVEEGFLLDVHTHKMIDSFVKEGYVVVAPDYEGLGEPNENEIHPFLILKSEAYSITDAVVATKNWLGDKVSNKWAVAGISQGGHAALGAAQYAARANMDYKGAVAMAPANNLEMIESLSDMAVAERRVLNQILGYSVLDTLTSYMAAGMKSLYPTEPVYSIVFKSPTDKTAEKAESLCLIDMVNNMSSPMFEYWDDNDDLKDYPRKNKGYTQHPIVRQFLDKDSQPLQTVVKTPIIIYQGGKDVIVLPRATDALVAQARALTTKIDYRTNPDWDHVGAFTENVDNGQLLKDIKTLLAN